MFKEIIGHDRQQHILLGDLKGGNVAHAYLFAGPRHVGKFTVAKWFAWEILCAQGGDRQETARLLDRNIHPDVLVLDRLWVEGECTDWSVIAASSNVPQEHRARSVKARTDTIHIDDVRALQERLYETSTVGVKVLLLRSLERLQEAAGNALLNILEDPPASSVFLCTTQSLSAVLPTVRSRMRCLLFSPCPEETLRPLLTSLPTQDQAFLLAYAQGAAGRLHQCLQDKDHLQRQRQLADVAERILSSQNPAVACTLLQPLSQHDERAVLMHMLLAVRERMRAGGTEGERRCLQLQRTIMDTLRSQELNVQRDLLLQYFALSLTSDPTSRSALRGAGK